MLLADPPSGKTQMVAAGRIAQQRPGGLLRVPVSAVAPSCASMVAMALTTTVITEKGGAGKTTVTLGLASAAMATGNHVLVIDMDPQGSATHWLGTDADQAAGALVRALEAPKPGGARDELLVSTWADHVHVLPAARDLRD